jgi:hypothetical protein
MHQSKLGLIKSALAVGDRVNALKLRPVFMIARWTQVFKTGFSAHRHPQFYRQLGKDPDRLVAEAIAASVPPVWS